MEKRAAILNSYKLPLASSLLLVLMLIAVSFFVIALIQNDLGDRKLPKINQGVLDLSTINLANVSSIPLSGEWRFDWMELIAPSAIESQSNDAIDYINVPQSWGKGSQFQRELSVIGHATYRATVLLDKPYATLAMRIPQISASHALYVGDRLISKAGKVTSSPAEYLSGYQPDIILFQPKGSVLELTLHVANYEFYWGGIWQSIRLGSPEKIYKEQQLRVLQTTFIVAIFFTICAFNVMQFSLRTEDYMPIAIAGLCIMLAIRELETSQILFVIYDFVGSFNLMTTINYLTFYLTLALAVYYCYSCFREHYQRWLARLLIAVPVTFSLITLLTTPATFSPLMPIFQGFTFFVMGYVVYGLVRATMDKQENAKELLIGTSIMCVLTVNDILVSLGLLESVPLVSFGLIAFVLCQNYLKYRSFIFASEDNKHLNTVLEQRNQALMQISSSLEEQVQQRTQELKQANQKLQSQANQDPLTGLANRRGLQGYLETAQATLVRHQTPSCFLILDFDHFKQINDDYGHETGDRVLVEGSALMQSIVRPSDHLGRWGGEEFLFVCLETSLADAQTIAEKIRSVIFTELSKTVGISVSATIGIAQLQSNESIEQCVKRADDALYQGKTLGRNRVEVSL